MKVLSLTDRRAGARWAGRLALFVLAAAPLAFSYELPAVVNVQATVATPAAAPAVIAPTIVETAPLAARPAASQPAAATQPAEPRLPPELAARVEALIGTLGDDSWRRRQEAQDELAAIGPDIRPRLLRLARQTEDEEVRMRAEAVLRQIDENRTSGTSRITLHLKKATPAQVFAEVSRQANAAILPEPADLFTSRTWPAADFDVVDQTFWSALRQVCAKWNLSPQNPLNSQPRVGGSMVIVEKGSNPYYRVFGDSPYVATSGPFMIVVNAINATRSAALAGARNINRNCYLQMVVYAEPKMRLLQVSNMPRVDEAVDENGNALASPMFMGNEYLQPANTWAQGMNISLTPRTEDGRQIARIRGAAHLVIQSRAGTVEIADPLTAKDVTRSLGGKQFTLKGASMSGTQCTVRLGVARAGFGRDDWGGVQGYAGGFKLLDAAGNALYRSSVNTGGSGPEMIDVTAVFDRTQPDRSLPATGEPAKLVWEIPVETRDVYVPFDFANLPMP